jgi:23S rRNA (uridine2552-2'-O)-methyltransferase
MSRRKNPYAQPDARTRAAKAQGYPARSVFKLEEIDRRARLFRRGQRVLDLGAAPGSWTMYALERVGPEGRVLAVDLSPVTAPPTPNLRVLEADVLTTPLEELGAFAPYDVVLSDMAPNTSGSKVRDQTLSFELFMRALEIVASLGRPGAGFVAKLFMGPDFEAARRALVERFSSVRVMRPETTRKQSSEVFLVGLGKR